MPIIQEKFLQWQVQSQNLNLTMIIESHKSTRLLQEMVLVTRDFFIISSWVIQANGSSDFWFAYSDAKDRNIKYTEIKPSDDTPCWIALRGITATSFCTKGSLLWKARWSYLKYHILGLCSGRSIILDQPHFLTCCMKQQCHEALRKEYLRVQKRKIWKDCIYVKSIHYLTRSEICPQIPIAMHLGRIKIQHQWYLAKVFCFF